MIRSRRGQVTVEIAVLFCAIVGALVFMLMYLQRGAQGMVKGNADSLGSQYSAQNTFSSSSTQRSHSESNWSESTSCAETEHALTQTGGGSATAAACTPSSPTGYQQP